jgi:DNA polymerase V
LTPLGDCENILTSLSGIIKSAGYSAFTLRGAVRSRVPNNRINVALLQSPCAAEREEMSTRVPRLLSASVDSCSDELPLALARVPAGFPSPAEDYLEQSLDIARYLVKRPKTTFFMRVEGDSMIGAGINDGDLLVIDRAETARDKSIVVARTGEEFCVKQLRVIQGRYWLYPANSKYQPVEIGDGDDAEVWGVVTHAITDLKQSQSKKIKPGR